MKKALLLILVLITNTVFASARLIEVFVDNNGTMETYYVMEIIATPEDFGRPGAFYIAGVRYNEFLYLGATEGWRKYDRGMGEATEIFTSIPRAIRLYNPLTGAVVTPRPAWTNSPYGANKKDICARVGAGRTIELWGGVGSLAPDKEEMVQTWHKENNPLIDPNHIRNVYVQVDMQKGKKYWYAGSITCEEELNG